MKGTIIMKWCAYIYNIVYTCIYVFDVMLKSHEIQSPYNIAPRHEITHVSSAHAGHRCVRSMLSCFCTMVHFKASNCLAPIDTDSHIATG